MRIVFAVVPPYSGRVMSGVLHDRAADGDWRRVGAAGGLLSAITAMALLLFAALLPVLSAPAAAATPDRQAARGIIEHLPFRVMDCQTEKCPSGHPGDWTWFDVDPQQLKAMPAGWQLLVDNTRQSRVEIWVGRKGSSVVFSSDPGQLGQNWSLGNNLRFGISVPGNEVSSLRIGMRDIDSPALMRSVKAMDQLGHANHLQGWTVLVAMVLGVLVSALTYNIFLLSWLRTAFQNWYVIWLFGALGYLLVWTGALLPMQPWLVGSPTMEIVYLLVALMVVAGAAFFLSLVEDGIMPPELVAWIQGSCAVVTVAGVVAAFGVILPPRVSDILFNLALTGVTALVLAGVVIAASRRSRAVWFYLAGWTPPLLVLGLRVARNFGLAPQDDSVDQAGFAALGWESLLLSLAIADRFRQMRKVADEAVTERQSLMRVATSDPLTGLGNRALFQSLVEQTAMRRGGIDVITVDIDFLKQTNDWAGHDAGDALIVAVAERLAAAAGPEATIARVGGDEFVIFLEGEARARLGSVRQMIEISAGATLMHGRHELVISMCAGHATTEDRGEPLERIVKQADIALYRAKGSGRGCWRSYDESMADETDSRSRMLAEARLGLQAGQFLLHYQRVYQLDGTVVGFEALLRWQHPRLGLLTPGEFAEVLKEASLLPALQHRVLTAALSEAALVRGGSGNDALTMAVNFVVGQLQGTAAAVAILDEVARHGLPPSALVVDVSEHLLGGADAQVIECLECLRDAGVNVALDDYGAGKASLSQLRRVPANLVRIDSAFIASLADSANSRRVVKAMIDLAHGLGKVVAAKGIESEMQRKYLVEMGCDLGQGRLLGRPDGVTVARAA